jgi:hypothetical protein
MQAFRSIHNEHIFTRGLIVWPLPIVVVAAYFDPGGKNGIGRIQWIVVGIRRKTLSRQAM